MNSSLRSWLPGLLKTAVSAGFLYWLIRRGVLDLSAIGSTLERWPLLLGIAAIYVLQLVLVAWRWNLLLASQQVHLRWPEAFSLTMIGVLFNFIIPSSVGGDVMKSYYIQQRAEGPRKAKALATIFLDRVIGLLALLLVGAAAAFPSLLDPASHPVLRTLALFSALGAAAGLVMLLVAVRLSLKMDGREPASRWARFLVHAFGSLAEYWHRPAVLAGTIAISIVSSLLSCAGFYLAAQALGVTAFPARFLFLVPLGLMSTAIPISPAGIGVGQAAFAELFRVSSNGAYMFGANAFTVSQAVQFLINLCGFFFYLSYRQSPHLRGAESVHQDL